MTSSIKNQQTAHQVTILCVDDEANVLSSLRRLLRNRNYQLLFANNGLEALTILDQQSVDLIISDMRMPEMDGATLLEKVAQDWPEINCILLTGYSDLPSTIKAINLGNLFKYIKKPWDDQDLLQNVQHALALKFSESERKRLELLIQSQNDELQALNSSLSKRALEMEMREARLGRILNSSKNEIYIFDTNTLQFIEVNKGAQTNLGYSSEELSQMTPVDIKPEFNRESFLKAIRPLLEARTKQYTFETTHQRKDKSTYPVEVRLQLSNTEEVPVCFAIVQDITERKKNEEQIHYLAYYDSLTNLPNRRFFIEKLNQSLNHARRNNKKIAVLYIGLDRFKQINETLGHSSGDTLLIGVGNRLNSVMRDSDCISRQSNNENNNDIYRLGGDEFTICLGDINEYEDAAAVARRIQESLQSAFIIDKREIYINTSIGIAIYPNDGDNVENLLKNSDTAMYHAKSCGRNNFRFYDDSMNSKALASLEMENKLRKALELNEFELYYQPKINLASSKITGVEALLRWKHTIDGWISPADFIPIAEDNGLIIPIGEWVINTAFEQCGKWCQQGFPDISIAINLSGNQFPSSDLTRLIRNTLKKHNVSPHQIEFEITESILMEDAELATTILGELKNMGFTISIDDFGTGYSSLSYLKKFPVDTLKIDRSFIRDVHVDVDDAAISSAIIAMAHSLGLKVVAEGVENTEQLIFLQEKQCNEVQGFYFSKPVPADELTSMLVNPPTRLKNIS